jgi:hypothetical protein
MAFRAISALHCLQLDPGALSWPTDRVLEYADAVDIDKFTAYATSDKLAVYVWAHSSPWSSTERGLALVGLAAASIARDSPLHGCILVSIHALAIKESSRQQGLEQRLYEQLHEAVFELGQQEYALKVSNPTMLGLCLTVRPFMELHILRGSCCQSADALVLYENNRWRLTCDGTRVTKDVLSEWVRQGTSLDDRTVELSLAPVCLSGGYFASAFEIDSTPVGTFPTTSEVFAVAQARCVTNFVGTKLVCEISVIGPSKKLLALQTGLLPFFAPAAPCRALDDFLQDPVNWFMARAADMGSPFPVQHLRVGGENMMVSEEYDHVNSDMHSPDLQASMTVKTQGRPDVEALLEFAPGFAILANVVLRQLGYPERCCLGNAKQCSAMLKAVHFCLDEASRQTSLAWHTDDTDLCLKTRSDKLSLRSATIQLGTEARTAMQILGFRPFAYEGRGAGALFHGAAVHRNVNVDPPPRVNLEGDAFPTTAPRRRLCR